MKKKFEERYTEGCDLTNDALYSAWKILKTKSSAEVIDSFPIDNSSPADPDNDVLDYPVLMPTEKKRKRDDKRYFILTADDAYANAVSKQKLKEQKEKEKLERRKKKCLTTASTRPQNGTCSINPAPSRPDKEQLAVVHDPVPETSGVNMVLEINISEGSYIALYQEGEKRRKHLYFGVILEILDFGELISVQFLEQHCMKNLFVWPDVDIIEKHPVENVLNNL
ncbi:uncharacterized protein LOC141898926 [Tubulanus polymorphus]|uniref:uncharacterized protein LOC141898926 n=1 Tax=Tubulanus polymorphus TaxID=672921 RepID=UPI003DA5637D